MTPRIAIVLKGYPRLSETFVAQEIRALEQRGFSFCIVSLRHPYDPATHPIHDEIVAPVLYLPEYAHDDWRRVFRACRHLCLKRGFWSSLLRFATDLVFEPTRNRARRFAQAMVMAYELPPSVRHYYTHFMHTPSSVSYYASLITGCSWSISAHAKDIWTQGRRELRNKLASADWTVTCTRTNYEYLSGLAGRTGKVALLYHGIDFERFRRLTSDPVTRDGSLAGEAVQLISVGRAVDKKGYDDLLAALAELPADLHWKFTHIGAIEKARQLSQKITRP